MAISLTPRPQGATAEDTAIVSHCVAETPQMGTALLETMRANAMFAYGV